MLYTHALYLGRVVLLEEVNHRVLIAQLAEEILLLPVECREETVDLRYLDEWMDISYWRHLDEWIYHIGRTLMNACIILEAP
jgi:hypothetical protein